MLSWSSFQTQLQHWTALMFQNCWVCLVEVEALGMLQAAKCRGAGCTVLEGLSSTWEDIEMDALFSEFEVLIHLPFQNRGKIGPSCNCVRCGTPVMSLITKLLERHDVDFANVVELPESYQPPDGWSMHCRPGGGGDTTCASVFLKNSEKTDGHNIDQHG